MNVFRGEEFHHLLEYVLQELERRVVADAEVVVNMRLSRARQVGIDRQHLLRVARHLDFGNHRDMQRIGIGHHFADVVLRVESAVGVRVVTPAIGPPGVEPRLPSLDRTPSRELGQLGITVDLDAPPRTVRQMPMEAVEFERGHHPQLFFHKLLAEEVARLVQVHAAEKRGKSVIRCAGIRSPNCSCNCKRVCMP